MRTSAQRTGDAAEAAVAAHLAAMGWQVVARNVRVGRAELDLVAIDPAPPAELVIVEVRARGRRDFGLAEESLDHAKRRTLRRAIAVLRERGHVDGTAVPSLPVRVDLVAVEPPLAGTTTPRLRHHRGIAL